MKAIKFSILHFAFYIIITPIFLFILSCSSPTNNPKGSLSGVVFLEGQNDHSGIVIGVYQLAELDPDIVYANETWPHIGVIINQHTEFDHRLQAPIAVTQTEADGSFELTKIPIGTYNLIAIKDGWGFKYLLEVEILEGENNLADKCKMENVKFKIDDSVILSASTKEKCIEGQTQNPEPNTSFNLFPLSLNPLETRNSDITLFAEEVLSSFFPDQSNHFLTDHHYIIDEDTELLPNQYLEIQPGAVVRINPGVDLTIHGTLKAQGQENNMFWVTSNDGFTQQQVTSIQQLDEVELYNSMELSDLATVVDDLITWGKWSWGNESFYSTVSNSVYHNLCFRNNFSGLKLTYAENISICNVLSYNCCNATAAGVVASNIENLTFSENILIKNHNGLYSKFSPTSLIKNNYILKNYRGIWGLTLKGSIEHNELVNNSECDIKLAGNTTQGLIEINYNNIRSNTGVWQYEQGSFSGFYVLQINYNNFFSQDCFIKFDSSGFYHGIDIDATNNYYDTASSFDMIYSKIIDTNILHPVEVEVIIQPFLTDENPDSGVQG